jgi:hypothetical protein
MREAASDEILAKLFMSVLASSEKVLEEAKHSVECRYGLIDVQSTVFPFVYTTYYNEEMGEGILRQFFSFHKLFDPGELREIKRSTIGIESEMAVQGKRKANLDPGYLNLSTVVLATTKDASYRVYLGERIYAEPTLSFRKGEFRPFEWTYSDYRAEESLRFFGQMRRILREQLRAGRR